MRLSRRPERPAAGLRLGQTAETLRRAVDERRIQVSEVERLRDERGALEGEIASLRQRGLGVAPHTVAVETAPAPDLVAAVLNEMRAVLDEILVDTRARTAAPPPPVLAPLATPSSVALRLEDEPPTI